jgi:hypothetical protein
MLSKNPQKFLKSNKMAETSLSKFQPSRSLIFSKLHAVQDKVEKEKTEKTGSDDEKLDVIDYLSEY